jgi:hypothetical protein
VIEAKLTDERATLPEFALYFVKRVGEVEGPELQEAARVLGELLGRNLEIRTVTILGAGFFGAAAAHRNRVLKLTTDQTEPAAAHHLVGKKLRHVVRFHEAALTGFTMVRHGGYRELPVGVVLSEKVDSLGLEDGKDSLLDEIVSAVKREFGIFEVDWENLEVEEVRVQIEDASLALEELLLAEAEIQEAESIREVARGLVEARQYGVHLLDVHARNVGYDRGAGVHKIFDVGLASSPGNGIPEMRGRSRHR